MIDFKLDIEIGDEVSSITGNADSILVLIEAARRDLNAMSQAAGASNERKQAYGNLAARLREATAHMPRVCLLSGVVSNPGEIAPKGAPAKALEPVRSDEEITLDDDDDDDILG